MALSTPINDGANTQAASSNWTVSTTAQIAQNQLLLMWIVWASSPTAVTSITTSNGGGTFTSVLPLFNNGSIYGALYSYIELSASPPATLSVTVQTTTSRAAAYAFVGMTGTSLGAPVNQSNSGSFGAAATVTGPSVTPSVIGTQPIAFWGVAANGAVGENSGSWTHLSGSAAAGRSDGVNYQNALTADTTTAISDTATFATTGATIGAIALISPPGQTGSASAFRRRFWRLRP